MKEISKKLTKISSLVIIIFFVLSGVIFIGNLLHELSHKVDFKDYAEEEELCILTYPKLWINEGVVAYYKFDYNSSFKEEVKETSGYTEFKAYFLNTLLLILFSIVQVVFIMEWLRFN